MSLSLEKQTSDLNASTTPCTPQTEKVLRTLSTTRKENRHQVRSAPVPTPTKNYDDTIKLSNTNRVATLEKKLQALTKQLESESKTAKSASIRASQFEEKLKALTLENQKIAAEKASLFREVRELKIRIRPVDITVLKVTKQKDGIIESLESRIKLLEIEQNNLTTTAEETTRRMQEEIKVMREAHAREVLRLNEEKEYLSSENNMLKQKVESQLLTIEEFKGHLNSQNDEKKSLINDAHILRNQLSELSIRYEKETRNNQQLNDSQQILTQNIQQTQFENHQKHQQLSHTLQSTQSELSMIKKELQVTKTELDAKSSQLDRVNSELKECKMNMGIVQREREDTVAKLFTESAELAKTSDKCLSLNSELESLKRDLSLARHEVSQYSTLFEDTRSSKRILQVELEKSQTERLSLHTEVQTIRADSERNSKILAHIQEERQAAIQEINFLKSLNNDYLSQISATTQQLTTERMEKVNLSNYISSADTEIKFLIAQIEEYKTRELVQQQKSEEKLTFQRKKYETEIELITKEKSELEEQLNSRDGINELEKEWELKLEIVKADYEQKIAEHNANTFELRRSHASMLHDTNIIKRENDRLKELLKSRETKLEKQKDQLLQMEYLASLNQVLKEQFENCEKELASVVARNKKLQSNLNTSSQTANELVREEKAIWFKKLEDLEIELKSQHERVRMSNLQRDELLSDQAPKTMNEKQKMDYVTKLRKENLDFKQENSKLVEQLRLLREKFSKQKPQTSVVHRFKQSIPPPNSAIIKT